MKHKLSETHDAINQIRNIRSQVEEWEQRAASRGLSDAVASAAGPMKQKLESIEDELVQVKYKGARDRLNLPVKLNRQLAELVAVVASADYSPPQQVHDVFRDLSSRIDTQLTLLLDVVELDVANFIDLVNELEIPPIVPSAIPPQAP
jgi:hypothetical protein